MGGVMSGSLSPKNLDQEALCPVAVLRRAFGPYLSQDDANNIISEMHDRSPRPTEPTQIAIALKEIFSRSGRQIDQSALELAGQDISRLIKEEG